MSKHPNERLVWMKSVERILATKYGITPEMAEKVCPDWVDWGTDLPTDEAARIIAVDVREYPPEEEGWTHVGT